MSHTPTPRTLPWSVARIENNPYGEVVVQTHNGNLIASDIYLPDAEYIVVACNVHPALVEALRQIASAGNNFVAREIAISALRSAGEEEQ